METIKVEITKDQIQKAFELAAAKVLTNDYGNPVREAMEKSIKEKEGEIKKVVDEIIVEAISNADFKERIAQAVIARMVESALKR